MGSLTFSWACMLTFTSASQATWTCGKWLQPCAQLCCWMQKFSSEISSSKVLHKMKEIVSWDRNQIETSLNDFWGRTISSNFSLFPRPFDLGLNCHLHYFKSCEYIGGCLKGGMWESIQEICSLENPSQTVLTSTIHFKSERNKISRHSNPNHSGKFISLAEASRRAEGEGVGYTKVHAYIM